MVLRSSLQGRSVAFLTATLAALVRQGDTRNDDIVQEINRLNRAGITEQREVGGQFVAASPGAAASVPDLYPGLVNFQPFDPAVAAQARLRSRKLGAPATVAQILAASGPVKNESGVDVTVQDFYNFETVSVSPLGLGGVSAASPSYLLIAGRALKQVLGGGGGRLTAAIWNSLPSLVRTALTQAAIGVGAMIAFNGDIPFITLPGQGNSIEPFIGPQQQFAPAPGGGALGVVIGGMWDGRVITNVWIANNILFWATGSRGDNLMHWVQRKNGSVKGWRPPKPVVLMPGGAKNLRDFVKAANILDKQGAQLQKVLRKRNPPARKEPKPKVVTIVQGHATGVLEGG